MPDDNLTALPQPAATLLRALAACEVEPPEPLDDTAPTFGPRKSVVQYLVAAVAELMQPGTAELLAADTRDVSLSLLHRQRFVRVTGNDGRGGMVIDRRARPRHRPVCRTEIPEWRPAVVPVGHWRWRGHDVAVSRAGDGLTVSVDGTALLRTPIEPGNLMLRRWWLTDKGLAAALELLAAPAEKPKSAPSADEEQVSEVVEWNTLTERQQLCMYALCRLGAFDAETKQRREDVAKAALNERDPNKVGRPLADLNRKQLVKSVRGQTGGYWLTDKGRRLVEAAEDRRTRARSVTTNTA